LIIIQFAVPSGSMIDLRAGGSMVVSRIGPARLDAIHERACSPSPQAVYEQLLAHYRADLIAASAPDTGTPVNIVTIGREPTVS
jgi:hypothetical protein